MKKEIKRKEDTMESRGEGRFLFGFILVGLAPLLGVAGAGIAGVIFAIGLISAVSAAF